MNKILLTLILPEDAATEIEKHIPAGTLYLAQRIDEASLADFSQAKNYGLRMASAFQIAISKAKEPR